MSDPFIAQITMFGGNFAPRGWAFCDGQLLPIAQFQALFSLLGTTYGGDGRTTFALPELRGRVPMHPGNGPGLTPRSLGEKSGVESVALTSSELPPHTHQVALGASSQEGQASQPNGNHLAAGEQPAKPYSTTTDTSLAPTTSGSAGAGVAHTNVQPFQCVNFIIALEGIFPSRS